MQELMVWVKGQVTSYGNPDQAVACVALAFFIDANF